MAGEPSRRALLPAEPLETIDAYLGLGGGEGFRRATRIGARQVIAEVLDSGLRGRGGAGFSTGLKWSGVAEAPEGQRRFLVCNAAEGEPGTFKDRALIRANPYQLLEGLAIAAFALGAEVAYVGIKDSYDTEISRLERAAEEMQAQGLLGEVPIQLRTGPDDYLLGEEKALLEAIEGKDPLPRWYPPYILGLHVELVAGVGAATVGADDRFNPTVVNNVETLSNVPHILREGPDWFRAVGTPTSPGTMVFTVVGDVKREAVAELPMGTPLSFLVYAVGEGLEEGRRVKAVFPGVSNAPIPNRLLETPMDFDSMRDVGSGVGSGGMIVYDDTACIVEAGWVLSRFLSRESCGQCPPCKLGTRSITELFGELHSGQDNPMVVDQLAAWAQRVTDANRCGLGQGQRALAVGILHHFAQEVMAHAGSPCWSSKRLSLPKIVDEEPGRMVYDESYFEWRSP